MRSQRSREGFLTIDHTASPGVSADVLRAAGIEGPAVPGGTLFESATASCSHCTVAVILNPDRSRPRNYCARCDHYICDLCAAHYHQSKICRPFVQVADEVSGLSRPTIILGDRPQTVTPPPRTLIDP